MSEIELLIFVLELFKLRCRGFYEKHLLKELTFDVLNKSHSSKNLNDFKTGFFNDSLLLEPKTFKLRNEFLKYLNRFDDMYNYISGNKKCNFKNFKRYVL